MSGKLIILGASARAAAFSALRAGFEPYCGDYFADADLQRRCTATAIKDYPNELEEVARASPAAPWMYTGAIENYPELITRISALRPLLGNHPDCLAQVRDPWRIIEVLSRGGLASPALAHGSEQVAADGTWLRKAYHSGGGAQVAVWNGKHDHDLRPEDHYFQQRITGKPCSGVYVAAQGKAIFLGASQQLIEVPWTGGRSFHYTGSVGPWRLMPAVRDQFVRQGDLFAAEFGLRGVFGVDAIFDGRTAWPIEINPRFPASVEILERALGFSAVGLHVAACERGELPKASPGPTSLWTGKAIVWARRKTTIGDGFCRWTDAQNAHAEWPAVADIPHAGRHIAAGSPICTVFAVGGSEPEVWKHLEGRAGKVYEQCESATRRHIESEINPWNRQILSSDELLASYAGGSEGEYFQALADIVRSVQFDANDVSCGLGLISFLTVHDFATETLDTRTHPCAGSDGDSTFVSSLFTKKMDPLLWKYKTLELEGTPEVSSQRDWWYTQFKNSPLVKQVW